MKIYLLIVSFLFAPVLNATVIPAMSDPKPQSVILPSLVRSYLVNKLISLSPKEVEKLTGNKIRLKEKVGFYVLKQKLKKQAKGKGDIKDHGKLSLIFGIVSLVILFVPYLNIASIPLAVLAIVHSDKAKKIDPGDRRAMAGLVLGIVTLALLLLFLGIALFLFANVVFIGG